MLVAAFELAAPAGAERQRLKMADTYDSYVRDVLQGIGAPTTDTNIRFMEEWAAREGVPQSIDQFNLWGTTLRVGNSYGTNSVGVQSYGSFQDGVSAAVSMLKQSNFRSIRSALLSGNPYAYQTDPNVQAEFLSWSGGGYTFPVAGVSSGLGATPLYSRGNRPSGGFSLGGLFGGVEHAAEGVGSAVASPFTTAYDDTLGSIGDVKDALKVILWLFSPTHWIRVFEILFGSLLLVLGLFFLGQQASGVEGTDDIGGAKDVAAAVGLGALIPVAGEARAVRAGAKGAARRRAARKPGPIATRSPGTRRRAGFEPQSAERDRREAKQSTGRGMSDEIPF